MMSQLRKQNKKKKYTSSSDIEHGYTKTGYTSISCLVFETTTKTKQNPKKQKNKNNPPLLSLWLK